MPNISKHEKGSVEYYADLAAYRERRAARKAQGEPVAPKEAPPEADEVFDLGDPEPARMEPPSASKEKGKKGPRRKLAKSEMLKEEDVHRNIKQPLDLLSRIEGHEHWHREDDEIAEIAGPATRILNRHPEWVDLIRTVGDPGALIFACVMVLGPSVMEEINRVRGNGHRPEVRQREARSATHGTTRGGQDNGAWNYSQQSPYQPSQAAPGGGSQGDAFSGPAQVQGSAAAVIPPPPDLPTQFLA